MQPGQVRIIGGQWRGRKLKVPALPGLRPTPNRIRETLFNWLMLIVPGARCLDLFSGSGALAIEALSRGASQAVLVDQSREVVKLLQEELKVFGATHAEVYQAKIPSSWSFLSQASCKSFDLVFLDPPYSERLLLPLCQALEEKSLLADPAYIYLEDSEPLDESRLPAGWTLIKRKKAGQVYYYLAERKGVSHAERTDSNH